MGKAAPATGKNAKNCKTNGAVVSLRESSVISLAKAGHLEGDQIAAAWRFRRAFERAGAARPAMAALSERVSAGSQDFEAEKRLAAALDLKMARRILGKHGYILISRICGEGFHIRDIYASRRERDMAVDLLKIHLAELAQLWR